MFRSLWKAFLVLSLLIASILNLQLLMRTGLVSKKYSDDNFTVNTPLVPCIVSSVNVKPTCVLKLFCDHPNVTWEHVNNIPSRPLSNIIKGPQYAVTRNFTNSIQANMDFSHCLSPYCFIDQIITSCMGLLIKGPWFTFAHTEIGGGASFALLNTGTKI